MMVGYNGNDFHGSQKNNNVRTVEEEIEKTLHKLGMVSEFNYGDLKKIGWNRATRTDKGVHALLNVFSAKLILPKLVEMQSAYDEEKHLEELRT